jgi:hypothetical protein
MKTTIFCVAHKAPAVRLPAGIKTLGVGQYDAADYFTGNGDHINHKNPRYSEVSAIYWLLNNTCPEFDESDMIGLCHYRRFFEGLQRANAKHAAPGQAQLSVQDFNAQAAAFSPLDFVPHFSKGEWLIPNPVDLGRSTLQFYSEKHLGAAHDIELAYEAATERGLWNPEFSELQLYKNTQLVPYCMSILPREQFKAIWTKILSTLLAIEPQVTNPQDPYQKRNMGFLAERLHSSALFYAERNGACLQRARVVQVG